MVSPRRNPARAVCGHRPPVLPLRFRLYQYSRALFLVGIRRHRSHLVLFLTTHAARAYFQRFHQRLQAGDRVCRRFHLPPPPPPAAPCSARLRSQSAAHNGVNGGVEIGIRHHNRVVFGGAEGLHSLAVGAGGLIDYTPPRRRSRRSSPPQCAGQCTAARHLHCCSARR